MPQFEPEPEETKRLLKRKSISALDEIKVQKKIIKQEESELKKCEIFKDISNYNKGERDKLILQSII
jgi:hypothetical protein